MRYAVFFSLLFAMGCGRKDAAKEDAPVASPSKFAADVHPVLAKACGACHSEGAKAVAFVDAEAVFMALGDKVKERLDSDDPKVVMPPPRIRVPLTEAERAILLGFLGKS